MNDADLRSLIRTAPLPEGSLLEFKHKVLRNASGKVISPDQDRLNLSKADALRFRRVWGIATSLRKEKTSRNTETPASAQVALRLNFLDRNDNAHRSFSFVLPLMRLLTLLVILGECPVPYRSAI